MRYSFLPLPVLLATLVTACQVPLEPSGPPRFTVDTVVALEGPRTYALLVGESVAYRARAYDEGCNYAGDIRLGCSRTPVAYGWDSSDDDVIHVHGGVVTAVAAGGLGTCALDSAGRAFCWGSGDGFARGRSERVPEHRDGRTLWRLVHPDWNPGPRCTAYGRRTRPRFSSCPCCSCSSRWQPHTCLRGARWAWTRSRR